MPIIQYNDCPPILRDFLMYMLTIRGRSQRTVGAYHVDLRLFLRYLKFVKVLDSPSEQPMDEISIEDFPVEIICSANLSDVYSFLNYVLSDRMNNASTRARKVSALRTFYKYIASKTSYLDENPMKDLEIPSPKKSVPRYLTLDESKELLSGIPQDKNSFYERDYCIITLFLNCGMRLAELCNMNIIDIRDNTLRLTGKGNKERVIYLNSACLEALDQYMRVRENSPKEPDALFLSKLGRRINPRRVEQIVEEGLRASGLSGKGYSPHKLRHTAATLMYQHGGVDIRALQQILGHESLATTEIYTHVSNKQLENAANASPLANIKRDQKRAKDDESQ